MSRRTPRNRAGRFLASQKVGWSGLFLAGALSVAAAEPLAIDIVSAEASFDQGIRQPLVSFKMSPASAKLFADFTAKNVGRKMEVRVDGRALMAPVIREPILGGSGQITNREFTAEAAQDLAQRLSAGKAKVEFEIVND
jgi:preprotein translocase subunit SecD